MIKSCKSCAHLFVPPDSDGKRRVRRDRFYECGFVPEMPILPVSMMHHWDFVWPLRRRNMWPSEGGGCPCWKPK